VQLYNPGKSNVKVFVPYSPYIREVMSDKHNEKEEEEKQAGRGPKPKTLEIEGDWEEAVKKSLAKKKPSKGWPK
jgi:hypothetical protein